MKKRIAPIQGKIEPIHTYKKSSNTISVTENISPGEFTWIEKQECHLQIDKPNIRGG